MQIHAVITTIGIKMEGLECHVFIGGTPLNQDKVRLKKCHIAVGSPGTAVPLVLRMPWGASQHDNWCFGSLGSFS